MPRCFALLLLLLFSSARAQIVGPFFNVGGAPGVYLDVDGKVRCREVDERDHLAAVRARVRAAGEGAKNQKLGSISLPTIFNEARALRQAGKDLPADLRFLHGLTQIQYVFVYPDTHDIVLAGPVEPFAVVQGKGDSVEYAVGKLTGRPVLQLDDLLVALRTAREGQGNLFGCGIYPSADSMKIADEIVHRMARASRVERMKALADGLGPQPVKIFGTRNDTRLAYICVAADYEMKRFALGMERAPIPNLGSAMDNSRSAINKFWFAANYQPLLASRDGNSFEIRGQRLELQCGAFDFDPRGATDTARRYAAAFTKNMPSLAAAEPLFAELQNIADEALVGNLLLRDRLAERVGWDNEWIFDEKALPAARVPVPRSADTLVAFTNGSLVAGGVTLTLGAIVDPKSRQVDEGNQLAAVRGQAAELLRSAKSP